MTNYEIIKSMSIEEIALFLNIKHDCGFFTTSNRDIEDFKNNEPLDENFIMWLKMESK